MAKERYSQCKNYESNATFWTLIFMIDLAHFSPGIDGQTCLPTKNESFIVDWGKTVDTKILISSIWPNTEEDIVLRNDEGHIEGACSGRKFAEADNALQGITCWGNEGKGFIMESSNICLYSCYIRIRVSLTTHSTSGTYSLELNETRCQFWTAKIYYRDFKPTCSVWFHIESNYFIFSCSWTVGVRDGTARLLIRDLTLNETEYSGFQSIQTSITKTISTSIDLKDMFSECKVPDICAVSESGFEQNCSFSPITRLSVNELEEATSTLNCCIDSTSNPDIWIFNETSAFPVNTMVGLYKHKYSSPNDLKFGIVCGTSTKTKLVIYRISQLISKGEVITVLISNTSEGNALIKCPYTYKISITGLSGLPTTHSYPESTSILPMPSSTIAYDKIDNESEPTQWPISSTPGSAWIASPTESKDVISSKSFVHRMLIPLLVSSVMLLLLGAGMCFWFCRCRLLKLRYRRNPDGHDGTDAARSLHLPNTVDCGTGTEALQMGPRSLASHQSTSRIAPTHSGEEGNCIIDEEVYSLRGLNALCPVEHHYQNLGQGRNSEEEYGAYSSIGKDYCSVNDAPDLIHEDLSIISYSDEYAWCGEKSQSSVSVRNTSEIEAIYAKSNKQRLLNVTNADIDSPSSCSSTFLDHHDVRHVETSVTGGSWNSESSTSDDDITEGYASVSGILKSNLEYDAISDICNPITSSVYDTYRRNIPPGVDLNTSIYAVTTPNTSSEAIYDSLQRPKVEIEGYAKN